MKVLIAEDTTDLNRVVTVMLQKLGYDVDSVYDGQAALDQLELNGYDAVILDIMMPKMDGITALKNMRSRGINVPVLMLTAKSEVDDRVAGLDAGADDYLPKPFAMKELVARVRSLARRNTDYGVGDLAFADITLGAGSYELQSRNSVRLSHLEYELLRTFVLNPARPCSTDFLLGRVWSGDDDADASAVALYVRYLNNKLEGVGSAVRIVEGDGGYTLVSAGAGA